MWNKKLGIEVNGVLRNTILKIQQTYQKYLIDLNEDKNFEYKIISDISSLNLLNHLTFQNEDEIIEFLYEDFPMEIFGHAGSTETFTFNDLNQFYLEERENYEIIIVSDEIAKSKPSTLFFLSKFGCLIENYRFYSKQTINSLWDNVDILLTANPDLLLNHPDNKTVIKFSTPYNEDILTNYEINKIKDLKYKLKEIYA